MKLGQLLDTATDGYMRVRKEGIALARCAAHVVVKYFVSPVRDWTKSNYNEANTKETKETEPTKAPNNPDGECAAG